MSRASLTALPTLALTLAGCAPAPQAPSPIGAGPLIVLSSSGGGGEGVSGSQAVTLDRIRVTQGPRAFYAVQAGSYVVATGTPVEIWVEGSVTTGVPPRLLINWGDGGIDNTGCGSCKLSHTYSTASPNVVTVTLDDRVSVTEKWSFTLNVVPGGESPLRLVFTAPTTNTAPTGTFVNFLVEAFHDRSVPVTINCTLVCIAPIACSLPVGTASGLGRAFLNANVAAGSALTLEDRCTATAEDLTVSAVKTFTWQ